MTRLKISIIALFVYLAFIFNIERLAFKTPTPLSIHSFVFALIVVAILSIFTVPALNHNPFYWPAALWVGVYLALRLTFYNQTPLVSGAYVYLTITELVMLLIALGLAHSIAQSLKQVVEFIERFSLPESGRHVASIQESERDIKLEFVRSRRHKRPLSLVVVEPCAESLEVDIQRAIQDIQKNMLGRFIEAKLAQVINKEARRTDLVLRRGKEGRFVVLCPETNGESSIHLAERIQKIAMERLGIDVAYGIASFPDEALTFEELLQRAEFNLTYYVQIPDSRRIPATITRDETRERKAHKS